MKVRIENEGVKSYKVVPTEPYVLTQISSMSPPTPKVGVSVGVRICTLERLCSYADLFAYTYIPPLITLTRITPLPCPRPLTLTLTLTLTLLSSP